MIPGKHPKEDFIVLGIRWTPGAIRTAVWLVLAAAGGGVLSFWDEISRFLAIVPVWALFAIVTATQITPGPPGWRSENAAVRLERPPVLSLHYDMVRRDFQT